MKNKLKSYLSNSRGMTLVEVLTAGTLLMILVFCFAPLFAVYSNTVTIAGENLSEVQNKAGIMEALIGIDAAGESISGSYRYNVSEIALKMSSSKTSISLENDDGKKGTLTTSKAALGMVQLTNGNSSDYTGIGSIAGGGSLLATPDGVNTYATINAKGSTATLSYFPKSLTDDFKEATIVLVGDGVTFSSTYATDVELYVTSVNAANKITKDTDYKISRPGGTDNIIVLTVYGGGRVSFETSPLIVYYEGTEYKIEVDAPTMIMVGEADTGLARSTDYHYYVSRGEMERDSSSGVENLIVLQRSMNSTDTGHGGGNISLTSAMNDVEWVSANDADNYAIGGDGKKYGYYIMCGDEGQVRRFWKDTTTGNYYWGGDYTDYTDILVDSVNNTSRYDVTETYSTEVSYKYAFTADKGEGYELGGHNENVIEARNMISANAISENGNVQVYLPYARAAFLHTDGDTHSSTWGTLADYESAISSNKYSDGEFSVTYSDTTLKFNKGRHRWLTVAGQWTKASDLIPYATATGGNVDDNIITLTSCSVVNLSGSGSAYQTDLTTYNSDVKNRASTGIASKLANYSYPTTTYNLYCGYIPAFIDVWESQFEFDGSNHTSADTFLDKMDQYDNGSSHTLDTKSWTNDARDDGSVLDSAWWKANLGIVLTQATVENGTIKTAVGRTDFLERYHTVDCDGNPSSYYNDYIVVYPYESRTYSITGKIYDTLTPSTAEGVTVSPQAMWGTAYGAPDRKQQWITGGNVVDVTVQYLSNPFAVDVAANSSDGYATDQSNNKDSDIILNWSASRETTTFLDAASTKVPSGLNDVNVSLLVGYTLSGLVQYGTEASLNSIMNNGIVYIRSGTASYNVGGGDNNTSTEYYTSDETGYLLSEESNTFHQFYYLHARTANKTPEAYLVNTDDIDGWGFTTITPDRTVGLKTIGNVFGARCWQNNRHISYKSMNGTVVPQAGTADENDYNYLRCHPLQDTKVTCVAWGTTWQNYPEAMWGTENGTVLSWFIDLAVARNNTDDAASYNVKTVAAEFQSYKWVDTVSQGHGFKSSTASWKDTIGSATPDSGDSAQHTFTVGAVDNETRAFIGFMDKATQLRAGITFKGGINENGCSIANQWGFISTLENINDIEYANDIWIAVGDQSDVDPDDYCASAAYSHAGSGSWVNVRYWVDVAGTGKKTEDNSYYHWKAVKITDVKNCNIVQINNVNGIWIATGYKDGTNGGILNDEYDAGEEVAIFWSRDPLNGWSSAVNFYANAGDGNGYVKINKAAVGGINSCATRYE